MVANKPKGWVREPVRHGLAAKGIKTSQIPKSYRSIRTPSGEVTTLRNLKEEGRLGLSRVKNWRGRGRVAHFADIMENGKAVGSWKISRQVYLALGGPLRGFPDSFRPGPPFKHIPTMDHFPEAIPVIRDHSDDKKEAERMATKLSKETGRTAYIVWRPQQAKKGSKAGYLVIDPKPWAKQ